MKTATVVGLGIGAVCAVLVGLVWLLGVRDEVDLSAPRSPDKPSTQMVERA